MKWQAYTYFPILLVARLSWLNESFKCAFGLGAPSENALLELKTRGIQYPFLERGGIILHYIWVFIVSTGFGRFSLLYSISYFMVATCSYGLIFGNCLWLRTQRNGHI